MDLPRAQGGELELGRAVDPGREGVAVPREDLELLAVPGEGAERGRGEDGDGRLLVGVSAEVQAAARLVEGGGADEVRSLDEDCRDGFISKCFISLSLSLFLSFSRGKKDKRREGGKKGENKLTSFVGRGKGVVVEGGHPEEVGGGAVEEDGAGAVAEVDQGDALLLGVGDGDVGLARVGGEVGDVGLADDLGGGDARDGELAGLALGQPQGDDLAAVGNDVAQHLGGGVQQRLVAKGEVGDEDLGLVAVDGDGAAVLGDGDFETGGVSVQSESMRHE